MLIRPPFQWAQHASNAASTPATTPGTTITSGVSNADGTAVTLLTALAFDCERLFLNVGGTFVAAAVANCVMDLLVDPAGGTSWSELIDSLIVGGRPTLGGSHGAVYDFPIWIKAGSSIGARMRCSHTVAPTGTRVVANAYGGCSRPDAWWCGQGIEPLGTVPASSTGTAITPGNTGTYSAWTTIGTSTRRYGAIQFGKQPNNSVLNALGYNFEFGYSSVILPGSPRYWHGASTNENIVDATTGVLFCDIPSGTTIQGRATCSGTAQAHSMAAYGVY